MKRITCAIFAAMTIALCGCQGAATTASYIEEVKKIEETKAPQTPVFDVLSPPSPSPTPNAEPTKSDPPESGNLTAGQPSTRHARLVAVGDIMIMAHQIRAAKSGEGYDFYPAFEHISPYIGSADIAIANLETPIAGEDLGFSESGTTRADGTKSLSFFNAPEDLLVALKQAGFNVLTTANNHALDKGAEGLRRTVENIRAAGLSQTGTFLADEPRYLLMDANGVSVAVLAYTLGTNKHTGGMSSSERANAINLLDKKRVLRDIAAAKEAGAEFVILCLHWGVEFSGAPTAEQERLAGEFIEAGADVIAGTHPHVLQRIDKLERGGRTGIVAYSLGNFVSNMAGEGHVRGAVLTIDIEKGDTLTVRASYLPTLCARVAGQRSVLPASPSARAALEGGAAEMEGELGAAYQASVEVIGGQVAVGK